MALCGSGQSASLAARYRGSFLGYFWTFANPLLMLAVYTFVFGIVFKARWSDMLPVDNTGSFAVIMFCGMTVFNIFFPKASMPAQDAWWTTPIWSRK